MAGPARSSGSRATAALRPPLPRSAFPVTTRWNYLNHAGAGPLCAPAADALAGYAALVRDEGGEAWRVQAEREEHLRGSLARLLGVEAADVAFTANTTAGLGLVATGLDWRPGDAVVVPDCEFASNLFPWLALEAKGVAVVRVAAIGEGERVDLERIAAALDAHRVRVVAVSWVQYGRGWRTDLARLGALCTAHDALLVVDAIQGVGVVPARFTEWGVDVAALDGYKWLCGPEGSGVVAVSGRARERLAVSAPGWNSVPTRDRWEAREFVLDPTARRYEGGTLNAPAVWALAAAVGLLLEASVEAVWAHVDALCGRLVEGLHAQGATVLTERSPSAGAPGPPGEGAGRGGSGIVTFAPRRGDADAVVAALAREGIAVRARAGGVRVSPHGYTTVGEIDDFLAALPS